MKFRKDINGLRSIAVIAVVLFHFNSSWLPGGFVGVDVFFVISGFLMTGIIFRGIEQDNFSILKFYVARANRIIPALAMLCFALLIFGWLCLTPLDYKTLGKHVGSSMGFLSNITYWKESGYFDAASHEKWLLHTWSLSAEWQFYIIYPLILVAMKKIMSLNSIKVAILIGTFLGFIFCIVVSYKWPNPAYYLLHTRAWEMMLGAVAYLYPFKLNDNRKKTFEFIGLALIIVSAVFITKENAWPGYLALVPVLGAFLLIQADRKNSTITGNVVFQKLGGMSYSIYLWHWPFVVAIYYYSLNSYFIYIGLVLSILFGFISNKYIERIRFRSDFSNIYQYYKCKPIYLSFLIGALGSIVFLSKGFEDRFTLNGNIDVIKKELKMPLRSNGYCFYSFNDDNINVGEREGTNCNLGEITLKPTTLLFGDSYAGHNEPFFDEVFKVNRKSFKAVTTNWCIASFTSNYTGPKTHIAYEQCLINRTYLKKNMHKYKNIIFSGSWGSALSKNQLDDLMAVIDIAANMNINVFIMAAPYRYEQNPLNLFYRSVYFNQKFDIDIVRGRDSLMEEANNSLKFFSNDYTNVHFLSRSLLYSKNNLFRVGSFSIPYSFDGQHLSILGAKYSAKNFMKQRSYLKIMSEFD